MFTLINNSVVNIITQLRNDGRYLYGNDMMKLKFKKNYSMVYRVRRPQIREIERLVELSSYTVMIARPREIPELSKEGTHLTDNAEVSL